MKVGDLVRVRRFLPGAGSVGVLIERRILHSEYRFDILSKDGKIIKALPETYIEVLNENR